MPFFLLIEMRNNYIALIFTTLINFDNLYFT